MTDKELLDAINKSVEASEARLEARLKEHFMSKSQRKLKRLKTE